MLDTIMLTLQKKEETIRAEITDYIAKDIPPESRDFLKVNMAHEFDVTHRGIERHLKMLDEKKYPFPSKLSDFEELFKPISDYLGTNGLPSRHIDPHYSKLIKLFPPSLVNAAVNYIRMKNIVSDHKNKKS